MTMRRAELSVLILILFASVWCFSPVSAFAGDETLTSGDGVEVTLDELVIKPEFDHDQDELFRRHAEKEFGIREETNGNEAADGCKSGMARAALRRDRLNAQEKIVYDLLKTKIDKIASGDDDYAVIDISLENMGVQQSYTAEELGLESIFDKDDPSVVTETARQAVNSKFQVGLMNILSAVLGDMPYELYWYDKTTGIAFEPPKIIGVNNGKGGALVFDTAGKVTFKMYVSADYSKGGYVQTFYTDKAKTAAASVSAEKARGIVEKYKDLPDYDKLSKYKDEVITLTDYDYQAVEDYGTYGIYGDPWQMIHVFDNDPETKVVCEGYSKAFQYLCDQSDFEDDSILCNCTTGDMLAENGAGGPHMWNTVAIGGRNYIVDLTNNDNVTDDPEHKAPTDHDELFMAGAEGSYESGIYMISWDDDDPDKGPYFIQYMYDEDTIRFFDEEELTISDKSYLDYIGDLDKEKITVSISLFGDSYHRGTSEVHTLRAGNLTEWIGERSYQIYQDANVLDVLSSLLKEHGFRATVDYSGYVSAVSDGDSRVLNEKDNGQFSGWMYTLNGKHVRNSVKEQTLKEGDVIVFHYTDDYRLEDDDLDVSAAEQVIDLINALPSEITLDDEDAVSAVRAALENLEDSDLILAGLITDSMRDRLSAAESRISELKEEADKEAEKQAAADLIKAKSDAVLRVKALAAKYAGKVLSGDIEELTAIFLETARKADAALTIDEVNEIMRSAEAGIKKLAQKKTDRDKKIAAAKKLKVRKVTVKAGKRKVTVKWTKAKGASGYQLQYRLKTKKKWTTLKKTVKRKRVVKKLTKGKKYQFRVRPYTKIAGKQYYGKWTKA